MLDLNQDAVECSSHSAPVRASQPKLLLKLKAGAARARCGEPFLKGHGASFRCLSKRSKLGSNDDSKG
jgi:hypothetical protein